MLSDLDKVLTSRGYAIKKSVLNKTEAQELRTALTMTPKVLEKFQKGTTTFPIYYESASRFYAPRHWAIKKFGEPEANIVPEGTPLPDNISFKGTPYPYQETIINTFINQGGNGLICVPCGRGKTFMALNIAIRLGKRFMIVVDKEFLMNQWKGEIENYIKGARVGIIQGNKAEIEPEKYDCTICMIQTICRREFPDGFFDDYGFTIFDECHHLGASYFSKALLKIQTKWMLGLSATPDRDDGLTKVFEYYLGEPVYQEKTREPDPTVIVKALWFTSEDPVYKDPPVDWRGEIVTARLLTQIVDFEPRNARILKMLEELADDNNRKILILSDRISHLKWFEDALDPDLYKVGYYVGGMKQDVLDRNAEQCQILLATYQMASEAMNIKTLNTVILATPRKKVEQSTGRILRTRIEDRKVDPCIIDVIDSHETYLRRWYIRKAYYKQCKYSVEHIERPEKKNTKGELPDECVIRFG